MKGRVPLPIVRRVVLAGFTPLLVLACSASSGGERTGAARAKVTSGTKTLLVPVDERARVQCRAEVERFYCSDAEAEDAIAQCLARIGATDPWDPCAAGDDGCIRAVSYAETCPGEAAVYPDAAACLAPRPRSCSFYAACVEQETPCGEAGYALGYGEKYCTAFENVSTFTPKGAVWRDAVMLCLQKELVPFTQPASTASCSDILEAAFASHPRCYTQPESSICFLPPSDIFTIVSTIGGRELLTARSRTQILTTIRTCLGQIGGRIFGAKGSVELSELRGREELWQGLERDFAE